MQCCARYPMCTSAPGLLRTSAPGLDRPAATAALQELKWAVVRKDGKTKAVWRTEMNVKVDGLVLQWDMRARVQLKRSCAVSANLACLPAGHAHTHAHMQQRRNREGVCVSVG